jgi:hypothetical protein
VKLKRWLTIYDNHWMMTGHHSSQKYLCVKEVNDGSSEGRFEKETGFFGNERERHDVYSQGAYYVAPQEIVDRYEAAGWRLYAI